MVEKRLEKSIQTECIARLQDRGCYVFRVVAGPMVATGTADILTCIRGWFVAIEFKREHHGSYGVTKPQLMRMSQVRRAGGLAFAVASVEEIDLIIDNLNSVVPCEICQGPVLSIAHQSMHGYCTECAQREGDLLSPVLVKEVTRLIDEDTPRDDIPGLVSESMGETITMDDVLRIEQFIGNTAPSTYVNGKSITVRADSK